MTRNRATKKRNTAMTTETTKNVRKLQLIETLKAIDELENDDGCYQTRRLGDIKPKLKNLWLVDKLLPLGAPNEARLEMLYAVPYRAKSFLATDLCLAVARGEEFMGRKTQRGGAIYVSTEGD